MNDTATMVQRLLSEGDHLSMSEAGRFVGATQNGCPVHASTVTRWALRGVKLPGGRRVALEHVRLGGRFITTKAAVVRFLAEMTRQPDAAPIPRTPADRRRAADAATKELDAMGV